jgi:hypothetical protein
MSKPALAGHWDITKGVLNFSPKATFFGTLAGIVTQRKVTQVPWQTPNNKGFSAKMGLFMILRWFCSI